VQRALEEFVTAQGEQLRPLGPDAAHLVEAALGAVSGGKRLRALFCQAGFRAVREPCGSSEITGLVRAAAALELLHASALVHDDLMDASDTRRGGPAVHRAFERRHREAGWRGDPEQYGAAAAVLLGDLMLSWADELRRWSSRRCGSSTPPGAR
jgi:geranylgeranyl diphosphate synthase type I